MPIINIHLKAGRTIEKKKRLVHEVTQAVCNALETTPDHVRIILQEMTPEDYAIGGVFQWLDEPAQKK